MRGWIFFGLAVLGGFGLYAARLSDEPAQPAKEAPGEVVVLLHGLGRTSVSMRPLARYLTRSGYRVFNVDYPSTKLPLETLVAHLDAELGRCCARANRIHFVTHSMGGILVRAYLKTHNLPSLGRVVMLSPPNRGTEIVDELQKSLVFKKAVGPSGSALGTDPSSPPNAMGPVDFELGVITGDRSLNPVFSWLIPGQDDGTVAVDAAKVDGMKDFLVVPASHTFIMRSRRVMKETVCFLKSAGFCGR